MISIGGGSDTAIIEVAKNRMESICGPDKIPVRAVATYKTQLLMSLLIGENIQWARPVAPFIKFELPRIIKKLPYSLKNRKPLIFQHSWKERT